ncbi:MAG: hypothetical protein SF066_20180 [Thermoanaerobaculia bacterium]|nr:hypothetical protein [Thermoanaerobaculia bacterium]
MKKGLIVLALVTGACAWLGYRVDFEQAGLARAAAWLGGAGGVVLVVLGLLRRV